MASAAAEALLISALINNQDVTEAARYGVTPMHFIGYPVEYSWVVNYLEIYREQPSEAAFLEHFKDFPFKNHTDVRYACDQVLEAFYGRKFMENATLGLEAIRRGSVSEAYEIITKTEYAQTSSKPHSMLSTAFLDSWEEPQKGIEVPYPTLQRATGGLKPGNLWYLAARLGQGKSAYLLDIATHAMLQGKKVLYYSLEMSEHELRARQHSILARKMGYTDFTATQLLRHQIDLPSYKRFLGELEEFVPEGDMHTHTPAQGPVSPAVISSRASEYDLIVVDYATLMVTDAGEHASSDWRTATQISNRLKLVGLAHGVPILAAAQINRDGEHGDLPPKIRNLAQADALGQDGDVVITMRSRARNVASIFSLEKNRHGLSGLRWWTVFDVDNGVFHEISEDQAEERVLQAELGDMR